MKYFLKAILAALLLAGAPAFAGVNLEGWQLYKTDGFEIYTDIHEDEAREMLTDFMRIKQVVGDALGVKSDRRLAPFTLYLFDSRKDFLQMGKGPLVAGYYTELSLEPTMVMRQQSKRSSLSTIEVLSHEYLPYLVRAMSGQRFPRWFDEGIAHFYSTLKVKRGEIYLGDVPEDLQWTLQRGGTFNGRLLPVEALLAPKPEHQNIADYTSRLYATSWLLTHYMYLGHLNGFSDKTAQLARYLSLTSSGLGSEEAFNQAFSLSMDELEKELKQYAALKSMSVMGLPFVEPKFKIKHQPIDEAGMAIHIYYLAQARGQQELAQELLDFALEKKHPTALAITTNRKVLAEDYAGALADITAFKKHSSDVREPFALSTMADAMLRIANVQPGLTDLRDDAITLLNQAEKLRPSPYHHFRSMQAHWDQNRHNQSIRSAIQLIKMMPSSAAVNLHVGNYMLKAKHYDYAEHFLQNALNWSHSEWITEEAQRYLDQLNLQKQQAASNAPAAKAKHENTSS
ncbi:hypothetical protein L1F30_04205 [Simiduia sp. 21SJ11W-1]|uniref:tetratricopeptide repeat protein n=1 Tax=Simiduia sp. 21SJ11W-1 TaxID=2909669 RepID=UPI00209FA6B5|nr:hypothetical protein [Simiduia sp. 21SJ11W-1]UTA48751.1 hypothetical protein L1F30_04205 [Simiduia sp. 21SJ11W-1]